MLDLSQSLGQREPEGCFQALWASVTSTEPIIAAFASVWSGASLLACYDGPRCVEPVPWRPI